MVMTTAAMEQTKQDATARAPTNSLVVLANASLQINSVMEMSTAEMLPMRDAVVLRENSPVIMANASKPISDATKSISARIYPTKSDAI